MPTFCSRVAVWGSSITDSTTPFNFSFSWLRSKKIFGRFASGGAVLVANVAVVAVTVANVSCVVVTVAPVAVVVVSVSAAAVTGVSSVGLTR